MLHRDIPVERINNVSLRMEGNKLVGTAIVFNQRSQRLTENGRSFYEYILPGAFKLERNITFVFRHNDDAVYGDTASGSLKLKEDPQGINFELDLPPYAKRMRDQIENKAIRGMSFSFSPTELDIEGDIQRVRSGELFHISPVYNPAYPQTKVNVREGKNLLKRKLQLREYIQL